MPRKYPSMQHRVSERYVVDDVSGCWVWAGRRQNRGYGVLNHLRVPFLAHRVAYEANHGPLLPGQCVMHKCDNPPCVNPDHLVAGTKGDNNRDAKAKGRNARGVKQHCAKLTEAQVKEIRKRRLEGEKLKDLSADYGVGISNIGMLTRGKTWAWLK